MKQKSSNQDITVTLFRRSYSSFSSEDDFIYVNLPKRTKSADLLKVLGRGFNYLVEATEIRGRLFPSRPIPDDEELKKEIIYFIPNLSYFDFCSIPSKIRESCFFYRNGRSAS